MPEPLPRRRGWRPARLQPALLVVPAVDGAGAGRVGVVEAGGADAAGDVRACDARGEQALGLEAQGRPGIAARAVACAPRAERAQVRVKRLMPGRGETPG